MNPSLFSVPPDRPQAVLSPCKNYRYQLFRWWADGPTLLFLGLNPSTADAREDDPTVRRLVSLAKFHGYGSLLIANVFALRSPDPDALWGLNPVGPDNDRWISAALAECSGVLCGWGAWVKNDPPRLGRVWELLEASGKPLFCLAINQGGSPIHPLYQRNQAPFLPFSRERSEQTMAMWAEIWASVDPDRPRKKRKTSQRSKP